MPANCLASLKFSSSSFTVAYEIKQICVRPCINKLHSYICTHSNEEYTGMEEGERRGIDFISCLWELPSAFLEEGYTALSYVGGEITETDVHRE